MKIAHIIDYFQPQLGYQETFLPMAHSRLGHEVCVITSDRYAPLIYEPNRSLLGNRIKGAGFFEEEGIKVWRLKPLFEVPHAIWMLGLERLIRELKPDVIIVHAIVTFSAIRIAKLKDKMRNFKLIYDDHMAFVASRSKLAVLYPVFEKLYSPLIQQAADSLVAVAETSKAFMNRKYGIPLERIVVIPLGADDMRFRFDSEAREETRQTLSIAGDDVLFIYAGKLIPEKGPHILVEAAMRLMEQHNNIKILLLGNGLAEYVEGMKHKIQVANKNEGFIWYKAVPNKELAKFYSASDVAVWPREGSLSMLEAMACGLPIVISDKSEVTERLRWQNGLSYTGDDPTDLKLKMEKLLDKGLRKEFGINGRKAIETELSWNIIAKRFLQLVEQ